MTKLQNLNKQLVADNELLQQQTLETQHHIQHIEQQLKQRQDVELALQSEKTQLNQSLKQLTSEFQSSRSDNEHLLRKIQELTQQNNEIDLQLKDLQMKNQQLESQLTTNEENIRKQLEQDKDNSDLLQKIQTSRRKRKLSCSAETRFAFGRPTTPCERKNKSAAANRTTPDTARGKTTPKPTRNRSTERITSARKKKRDGFN